MRSKSRVVRRTLPLAMLATGFVWLLVLALWSAESGRAAAPAVDTAGSGAKSASGPARPADADTPRYQVYTPPDGLGTSAGEPTLGVNTETGAVMYIANMQTLRVTFTDCVSPAQDLWEDVSVPFHQGTTLDPILFTDQETNRTFSSQLNVRTSLMGFTDDDGETWTPTTGGSPLLSAVDHQSVGGGPWGPNAIVTSTTDYPNAVYYCSQDVADASCSLSRDGGFSFLPPVPMYTAAQCGGLHGHVKVAPDGTVYVPNRRCGLAGANVYNTHGLAVSTDNGTTWSVRYLDDPNTPAIIKDGRVDPSVAIGAGGRVYMGMQNEVDQGGVLSWPPYVAVSDDKGQTWQNVQRIGEDLGIQNIVFPVMIAGDNDRAAFSFLGTTTPGEYSTFSGPNAFTGVWHAYVATTFDGGQTWTTVNATPNDPVQRGSICTNGTACTNVPDDRNLLDFNDITIDEEGRVLVAIADGCVGPCVQGPPNSYSKLATIIRQSGGKRLLAAFDPVEPAVPAAPNLTAVQGVNGVVLDWDEPDNGGSAITEYRVYRGTSPGATSQLATTTSTVYTDTSALPGTTYYYKVTAVNSVGEGAACSELTPQPRVDTCTLPGMTVLVDPEGDERTAGQPYYDILGVSAAEPSYNDNSDKIAWTLRVADLQTIPPASTWRIFFTVPATTTVYFVDMRTDAAGTVSYMYGLGSTTLGEVDEGSHTEEGVIQLVVSNDKIGNPQPGETITSIYARTIAGAVVPDNANFPGPAANIDYQLSGNDLCNVVLPPVCQLGFPDVPEGSTFYPYVKCLVCRSIVGGFSDGNFKPNASVTRGQLAKIVANSAGLEGDPGAQMYEDVPPNSTFYPYINRLSEIHVMGGYPCGGPGEACGAGNRPYFRPNANATRGQISKIVSNAAGFNDAQTEQTYEDVPVSNDPSSYYIYIERLTQRGVMAGYPCGGPGEACGAGNRPYFRPNANATRGQTSKIVANTFFPGCENEARSE